ncbi:DNA-binding protein [Plesiomonas shigelloides]|nr:DNA-binding protein [Plesiomonas shigelloides]
MAKSQGWESRRKEGVQGKAFEFSVSCLPTAAQAALLRKVGKVKVGGMTLDLPKPKAPRYCKEQLWARWGKANERPMKSEGSGCCCAGCACVSSERQFVDGCV